MHSEFLLCYICALLFFAGLVGLVGTFYSSWYFGRPRRFWLARLTYEDKETQKGVRILWLIGWAGTILGAFILSLIDYHYYWFIPLHIGSIVIAVWIVSKLIIACIIIIVYIFHDVYIKLLNWALKDDPIF